MPRLFHFSEEPDIEVFVPRPPLAHPEQEPLVWAVDEWHGAHYLLPRDCPRACFWAGAESTAADVERFLGSSRRVVAIEPAWEDAVRRATLYRYEFADSGFELVDETAGYYTSRRTHVPIRIEAISDLPSALAKAGVELRLSPDLVGLHLAVVDSTLRFSSMRLRNADDERAAMYS